MCSIENEPDYELVQDILKYHIKADTTLADATMTYIEQFNLDENEVFDKICDNELYVSRLHNDCLNQGYLKNKKTNVLTTDW